MLWVGAGVDLEHFHRVLAALEPEEQAALQYRVENSTFGV